MSGAINGSQSGTRPYLRIEWSVKSTDVSKNRSLVRLELYLMHPYNVSYSSTKSGTLQGQGFNSSKSVSGTGKTLIRTRELWIGHNSDGSKTQNFNATFNIQISFNGYLSSLSVSGNATLPSIPRASRLNSVSMRYTQQENTSNEVTISVTRYSSSFRHDFGIYVEGQYITSINGVNVSGSGSLSLSSSDGNKILEAMRNTTKGKLEVRMSTRNGSTKIGATDSSTSIVDVNSNVSPDVSSFSVGVAGNGYDASINTYVQNISSQNVKISGKAGYGAGVSSMRLLRRWSDGSGDTRHASVSEWNSGQIIPSLSGNGRMTFTAEIIDTRGRRSTSSTTVTVEPYTSPRIDEMKTKRKDGNATVVEVTRRGSFSSLNGKNRLTGVMERKRGSNGAYSTVSGGFNQITTGTFSHTLDVGGNDETRSYTYRFTVTDDFNNKASMEMSVSTSKVLMSMNKDIGIGIGKVHERGTLDIGGETHIAGDIIIRPKNYGDLNKQAIMQIQSRDTNGHAYFEWYGSDGKRKAYVGISSANSNLFRIENENENDIDLVGRNILANGSIISGGNEELWSGAMYLNSNQAITPNKKLSECPNGWVFCWSFYNGSSQNWDWNYTFVPKFHILNNSSNGIMHTVSTRNASTPFYKYTYITDSRIEGHSDNSSSPSNNLVVRRVLSW